MNDLIKNQNVAVGVITLKEITDLIDVRHNDAMRKVEALSKEPDFGVLRKTRISHIKGKEIDTYVLDKLQAIAVGARLNNSLLMKVIKRLEELEKQKNTQSIPQNYKEALIALVKNEEEKEKLLIENKKQNQFITNVVHNNTSYTATQVAKDFNISAKLFNKILLEANVIFKNNGTYTLTSRYQNFGLTEIKETQPNNENRTFLSLRWTSKGKNWLKNNFVKALQRCSEDSFNEYNKQMLSNIPSIPMPRNKRF